MYLANGHPSLLVRRARVDGLDERGKRSIVGQDVGRRHGLRSVGAPAKRTRGALVGLQAGAPLHPYRGRAELEVKVDVVLVGIQLRRRFEQARAGRSVEADEYQRLIGTDRRDRETPSRPWHPTRAVATLHFIYGLPAAGKTGLARALATEIRGLFICQDEWVMSLGGVITTVEQYVEAASRVRALITPLATRLLELGVSVVLDFAGNTVSDRAWVRSIFESAHADHVLHVLDVAVDECKRRLQARNADQPPGLYYGHVSEELFDAIVPHIVLPTSDEAFHVVSAGTCA